MAREEEHNRRVPLMTPSLTLVANSYAAFRAAKGEQRVFAGGVPANHSPILTILRAAAVAICCKCVLASPIYRDCRRPHRRIPCAWVVLRNNLISVALDGNPRSRDNNQGSQPCCRGTPWP